VSLTYSIITLWFGKNTHPTGAGGGGGNNNNNNSSVAKIELYLEWNR